LSHVADGGSSANTYTGGTNVIGGTAKIGNATALSTGAVTATGGMLDFNGIGTAYAISLGGGTLTNSSATA
jgi:hypothetical protein